MNKQTTTKDQPKTKKPKTNLGLSLPKFDIPLVMRGKKIGVIETVRYNPEGDFPSIMFQGKLLYKLENADTLVKLLMKEGIHLGEPDAK